MAIWVDADACPKPVKEILCRAAIKNRMQITFVANQRITLPTSEYLSSYQVAQGFDVADNEIVKRVQGGDLVITQDIPLAAEILENDKSALVLNPRGEKYTAANIKQRLAMRDFMESMRSDYGEQGRGQKTFGSLESKAFADQLDKYITKS